jgi:uncharacterized protein YjdB
VGDSFVLAALVRGHNGTRFPPAAVTWSADPPDVLKLDSGGGPAFAVGAGSTVLTAICRGARATLPIEVSPPRADEIVIDPPEHGIRAGDEIHLEAIARDKRGRLVGRPVAWQSADPGTATVTGAGVLLAQAPGLARITAVLDSVRTGIAVPVLPARVAAIQVSDRPGTVAGDAFTLSATPVDRWGSPLPDRTVLWSSSDVRVAVVAAGGRVHALRPGPVVLTASCEGISEPLRITVGPAQEEPALAPAPMMTPAPATSHRRRRRRRRRLEAGLLGATVGAAVFWLFLRPAPSPPPLAAVEPAGYVGYTGSRDTVGAASVAITRRPDRPLRPAATFQLAAEVRTSDGRAKPGAAVVWSVSDTMVARVDPASGLIRTARPGQVQVIAASGDRRDSIPVTVRPFRPRPVASIAITPLEPLRVGQAATLQAVVRDARGLVLADSVVTWGSSDVSVAAVDPATGQVTAETPGSAVIFARSGGDSTWLDLTVLPKAVARVIVHRTPPLLVGQSQTLVAIPTDAAGNAMRDRPVLWSSSDPEVLQVDEGSGIVSARSPGVVEVTATSDGTSGTVRITVFARDAAARFE